MLRFIDTIIVLLLEGNLVENQKVETWLERGEAEEGWPGRG